MAGRNFVFIIIAYPIWFVVIASISNSNLVNLGKVTIWPKDISFYGFQQVFQDAFKGCPGGIGGGVVIHPIVHMAERCRKTYGQWGIVDLP